MYLKCLSEGRMRSRSCIIFEATKALYFKDSSKAHCGILITEVLPRQAFPRLLCGLTVILSHQKSVLLQHYQGKAEVLMRKRRGKGVTKFRRYCMFSCHLQGVVGRLMSTSLLDRTKRLLL